MAELREERIASEAARLARTKWLHANGAERSFPCGVVDVEGSAIPVLVAIVPALWGTGFFRPGEVAAARKILRRPVAAPSAGG